ncbi:hypothetical protein ACFWOJ_36900 [Streptomyces sp. NPDC058439]|uniref:hypothetical protein n=1 Tax=Streptomyces sp. NPDC058439 TaxID=3346500 RepID=UPI003661AC76
MGRNKPGKPRRRRPDELPNDIQIRDARPGEDHLIGTTAEHARGRAAWAGMAWLPTSSVVEVARKERRDHVLRAESRMIVSIDE